MTVLRDAMGVPNLVKSHSFIVIIIVGQDASDTISTRLPFSIYEFATLERVIRSKYRISVPVIHIYNITIASTLILRSIICSSTSYVMSSNTTEEVELKSL